MNLVELKNRKGALKLSDVPDEVKGYLNKGLLETVNLTEWLAIDHITLISNILFEAQMQEYLALCLSQIESLKKKSTTQIITTIGHSLLVQSKADGNNQLLNILAGHTSDSVRSYAAFYLGLDDDLSIEAKLNAIRKLADDPHFGVREMAWMSVRDHIEKELDAAIDVLKGWSQEESVNIRRFACEATRPRGVWCRHIGRLKSFPELGLPIIEPLKSDPEKYVQLSVANWLNDASKSRPHWVKEICERWMKESPTKNTLKITERALRTVRKNSIKLK